MKLKDIIAVSMIPETLIRAVVKQAGGWKEFQSIAKDISTYGAAGGVHGFTYYTDTVGFFRKHKEDIILYMDALAEEISDKGALTMIKDFNCIRGEYCENEVGKALYGRYDHNLTTLYNAITWCVLEQVAHEVVCY